MTIKINADGSYEVESVDEALDLMQGIQRLAKPRAARPPGRAPKVDFLADPAPRAAKVVRRSKKAKERAATPPLGASGSRALRPGMTKDLYEYVKKNGPILPESMYLHFKATTVEEKHGKIWSPLSRLKLQGRIEKLPSGHYRIAPRSNS